MGVAGRDTGIDLGDGGAYSGWRPADYVGYKVGDVPGIPTEQPIGEQDAAVIPPEVACNGGALGTFCGIPQDQQRFVFSGRTHFDFGDSPPDQQQLPGAGDALNVQVQSGSEVGVVGGAIPEDVASIQFGQGGSCGAEASDASDFESCFEAEGASNV